MGFTQSDSPWNRAFFASVLILLTFGTVYLGGAAFRYAVLETQTALVSHSTIAAFWCDVKWLFGSPCPTPGPQSTASVAEVTEREREREESAPENLDTGPAASPPALTPPTTQHVTNETIIRPIERETIREVIIRDNIIDTATFITRAEYSRQIDALLRSIERSGGSTTVVQGGGGGAASLEDLSDVAAMTKSVGDLLIWSGVHWTSVGTSSLGIIGSGGAVDSVNGQTGVVLLDTGHLNENGNLYFTNARADARIASATSTIRSMLTVGAGLSYSGGLFTNTGVTSIGGLTGDISTSTLGLQPAGAYLTSFTELDPLFTGSDAYGIAASDITVWNATASTTALLSASSTLWDTAYSWGDHAAQNYLTEISTSTILSMFSAGGGLSYSTTTGQFSLSASIEDLNDVASMSKAEGDLLAWSGSEWTNVASSTIGGATGGFYSSNIASVFATSTPISGAEVVFTGAPDSAPSFSSGTLTLPSNTTAIMVEIWGGGGSGAVGANGGGGGGAGGYSQKLITDTSITYRYSIGSGGVAGSSNTIGGPSCLTLITCPSLGGPQAEGEIIVASGGTSGGNAGGGGTGGEGSLGDVNLKGGDGTQSDSTNRGGTGGSAPRGGGGGGGVAGTAGPGAPFGGGGGGTIGSNNPGNGGNGGIVITVYTASDTTEGADLAELYPTMDETLSPGDVIAFDLEHPGFVKRATGITPEVLAGVVSTQPGMTLQDADSHPDGAAASVPLALAGRVPVKVSSENGPVAVGDRLAAASLPGYAARALPEQATIGYALSAFDAATSTGEVIIFVDLGPGSKLGASVGADVFLDDAATSTDPASPLGLFATTYDTFRTAFTTTIERIGGTVRWLGASVAAAVGAFGDLFAHSFFAERASVGELEVGGSERPSGVTLYDEEGGAWCARVTSAGEVVTGSGVCTEAKEDEPQEYEEELMAENEDEQRDDANAEAADEPVDDNEPTDTAAAAAVSDPDDPTPPVEPTDPEEPEEPEVPEEPEEPEKFEGDEEESVDEELANETDP